MTCDGVLYTNHSCILLEGAKSPISPISHLKCARQGAKTKENLELNISRPYEGAN